MLKYFVFKDIIYDTKEKRSDSLRKIIFIILSILISTFAMSMEKSSENAQMTIKAKVIKPLTVETIKNMEFGKLLQEQKILVHMDCLKLVENQDKM